MKKILIYLNKIIKLLLISQLLFNYTSILMIQVYINFLKMYLSKIYSQILYTITVVYTERLFYWVCQINHPKRDCTYDKYFEYLFY